MSRILQLLVPTKLLIPRSQGQNESDSAKIFNFHMLPFLKNSIAFFVVENSHVCFKLHDVIDSLIVSPKGTNQQQPAEVPINCYQCVLLLPGLYNHSVSRRSLSVSFSLSLSLVLIDIL